MSIVGLVISLALFLIAIVVVARPFFLSTPVGAETDSHLQRQREGVSSYYERVLTNIRDLDEDFQTGKISEADYREEREVWVDRGIRLLRVGDSLESGRSLVATSAPDVADIDRAIEAAVQAFRVGENPSYHELSDGGAEA